MEKRYNNNATTNWFEPSNWTPSGIPESGDTAVFNNGSASCTLTASVSGVSLRFESNYAGTFTTGGHQLTIDGFCVPSSIAGVINLQNSTVINSGDVDLHGVASDHLTLTGTQWIQQGGTREAPKTWHDISDTTIRRFSSLMFDTGSTTSFASQLFTCPVAVNGFLVGITSRVGTYMSGSVMKIGENGSIEGTGPSARVSIYMGKLEGHTENIRLARVELRNQPAAIGDHCRFYVPVVFLMDGGATTSHTTGVGCEFFKTVTMQNTTTGKLTVDFSDSVFYGDLLSSVATGGTLVVSGSLTLAGSADQGIYINETSAGSNSVIHVGLAKSSGGLVIRANTNVCLSGRQPGALKLLGTADYTVCGDLELSTEPDTSELTGTFTPGPGIVFYRYVYASHFYVARLYVQSNTIQGGVDTLELKVIQDARQL